MELLHPHSRRILNIVSSLKSSGQQIPDIDPPRIVAIGKRDVGKSSVLEAISGIPFTTVEATSAVLAIEIVSRRAPIVSTTAFILGGSIFDGRSALKTNFPQKWTDFDVNQLGQIYDDAIAGLELQKQEYGRYKLKIELCGPDQLCLTVVDFPCLNIPPDPNGPTENAVHVNDLVAEYVRQPDTIILSIVPSHCLQNVETLFELLQKIRDEASTNTIISVITKPDDVRQEFKPDLFAKLALNLAEQTSWHWHVVRTLVSKKSYKIPEHAGSEQNFFETSNYWKHLPPAHAGLNNLQKTVAEAAFLEMLAQVKETVRHFDDAIDNIKGIIAKCGQERTLIEQHSAYLIDAAIKYEHLVFCALNGYWQDDFFIEEAHRLRARVIDVNSSFATTMIDRARHWVMEESEYHEEGDGAAARVRAHLMQNIHQMRQDFDGLSLIGALLRKQACDWNAAAADHVTLVADGVEDFLKNVLKHIVEHKTALILFEQFIRPAMNSVRKSLSEKIDELLRPYVSSDPFTLNTRYLKILDESQPQLTVRCFLCHESPEMFEPPACERIVEITEIYCEAILSVIVDNVALLAIEGCLLSKLSSFISPVTFMTASKQQLETWGAVSAAEVSKRQQFVALLQGHEQDWDWVREQIKSWNLQLTKNAEKPAYAIKHSVHTKEKQRADGVSSTNYNYSFAGQLSRANQQNPEGRNSAPNRKEGDLVSGSWESPHVSQWTKKSNGTTRKEQKGFTVTHRERGVRVSPEMKSAAVQTNIRFVELSDFPGLFERWEFDERLGTKRPQARANRKTPQKEGVSQVGRSPEVETTSLADRKPKTVSSRGNSAIGRSLRSEDLPFNRQQSTSSIPGPGNKSPVTSRGQPPLDKNARAGENPQSESDKIG